MSKKLSKKFLTYAAGVIRQYNKSRSTAVEKKALAISQVGGYAPWTAQVIKNLQEENQSFGNVLAIIHRDGGHYIIKHGHRKASKDAMKIVSDLRIQIEQLQEANCWISVEERLPEHRIRVLTIRMTREPLELQRDAAMDPTVAYRANGRWYTINNKTGKYSPTHWRPIDLPKLKGDTKCGTI